MLLVDSMSRDDTDGAVLPVEPTVRCIVEERLASDTVVNMRRVSVLIVLLVIELRLESVSTVEGPIMIK